MLKHLDLFAGIGGFSLAAQSVGSIATTQLVEINPYCQQVLAKNFLGVPIHDDIRTFAASFGDFDLVTAGFPCQDISAAGKQAGLAGERSGLFFEIIRIVRVVRPRFIVLENVANLLANGMDVVLRELSQVGYDAEWSTVSCAEVGGVHKRDRVWIVAYDQSFGLASGQYRKDERQKHYKSNAFEDENLLLSARTAANASIKRLEAWCTGAGGEGPIGVPARSDCQPVNTAGKGLEGQQWQWVCGEGWKPEPANHSQNWTEAEPSFCGSNDGISRGLDSYLMRPAELPAWLEVATDADKIPHRKERLQALGNAVVPQVAAIPLRRVVQLAAGGCNANEA